MVIFGVITLLLVAYLFLRYVRNRWANIYAGIIVLSGAYGGLVKGKILGRGGAVLLQGDEATLIGWLSLACGLAILVRGLLQTPAEPLDD